MTVTKLPDNEIASRIRLRWGEIARATDRRSQALLLIEVVMWICLFEESFAEREIEPSVRRRLDAVAHARNKGLHDAVDLSGTANTYSSTYTALYGTLVWVELPPALPRKKNLRQETAYNELFMNRSVLDALRPLVEEIEKLS